MIHPMRGVSAYHIRTPTYFMDNVITHDDDQQFHARLALKIAASVKY